MNLSKSEQVKFPFSFLYNVHFRRLYVTSPFIIDWKSVATFLTPISVETHSYSSEVMHLYITKEIANAKKHIWGSNAAYL